MPNKLKSSRHLRRLVNKEYENMFAADVSNLAAASIDFNSSTPQNSETSIENVSNIPVIDDLLDSNAIQSDENEDVSINTLNNDNPILHFKNRNDVLENVVLGSNNCNHNHILELFRRWCINYKITHVAIKDLLNIFRSITGFNEVHIPKDPRTFLCTPKHIEFRSVSPGFYYHIGIQNAIQQQYRTLQTDPVSSCIQVAINIDGLPLSDSSGSQLYPILCINKNLKERNVAVVGVYHGYAKPSSFNEFLEEFVNEAINLTENGVIVNGNKYRFKIAMFLLDAVAKSSVLYVKGHSGYFSCTKCTLSGVYKNDRMHFPETTFVKRTHDSFVLQSCEEYHTGRTILEKIPGIDLVQDIALDYMHLMCLGVTKKFIVNTWCFGRPPHRLRSSDIIILSNKLISFQTHMPSDFARRPRSLMESKRWKATEFRQFLLYSGPVVLKSVLQKQKYEHFLTLHIAARILSSEKFCASDTHINYAEKLLKHFVETTKILYENYFLSHNIHNLLHIADDVRRFGCLDNFSNFSSENYLQYLKTLIRKPGNILSQIIRRTTESNNCARKHPDINENKGFQLKHPHENGVLISDCRSPQYQSLYLNNFNLSVKLPRDSCCLLCDGSIVVIENFAYCPKINNFVIIGRLFLEKQDFFTIPCPSSMVNIFVVRNMSCLNYWPIHMISEKIVRLPFVQDKYVVLPLLHCAAAN